jgi:predicted GIY-YIG superfamily endonuclease
MSRNQHITAIPKRGTAVVYLIHFNGAYKHARHYLGFSTDLDKRITDHLCGMGARLLEVVTKAGIEWKLARICRGGRSLERRLKNWNGAAKFCPICGGKKALRLAKYSTEGGK